MTGRSIAMFAVLAACGGKTEDTKQEAGSGPATSGSASMTGSAATGSATTAITTTGTGPLLPIVTIEGDQALGYVAMTSAGGKLHVLGKLTLDDPSSPHPHLVVAGQPVLVDSSGHLDKPLTGGEVVTALTDEKWRSWDGMPGRSAIVADASDPVAVLDAVHLAGEACTNIVVAKDGHLAVLPICMPRARAEIPVDQPELYVTPDVADTQIVVTKVNDATTAHDAKELDAKLAEERAGMFNARKDARIIVRGSLTIGRLAQAIAALRRAGFTEVTLEPEVASPSPPTKEPAPTPPAGSPTATRVAPTTATPVNVTVTCARADGGSLDDCQKTVAKTVPILKQCFRNEMAKGAKAGNADLSFGLTNGAPKDIKIAGTVPNAAVGTCTTNAFARLLFDAKMMAARVTVLYKTGS